MGICKWFSLRRNAHRRLLDNDNDSDDSDSDSSDEIDEIIVHPVQNKDESLTSIIDITSNYLYVENILDFFGTSSIKNLLKFHTKKVLIFKLKIEGCTHIPDATKLGIIGQICSENSIVIILCTKSNKNFWLYWKSRTIKHFIMFKMYIGCEFMNDVELFEFMGSVLAETLKRDHLGLLDNSSILSRLARTSKHVELHYMADHRNYNFLLVAAEQGNTYIVDMLMSKLNISTEAHKNTAINAQTLAWNGRHFEVLLMLLKHNLPFPTSFNVNECPNDIKEFHKISHDLNEALIVNNESKVLQILSNNPEMRHFYNLNNESAVAFALKRRLFDMYGLLISKNIVFGPFENFSEIKEKMNEKDREKLRDIHFKESKFLPDNHMSILLLNSRLGHDTSNTNVKYSMIQKSFELLNENPFIKIILMIVAASKKIRIIFDFNRDSIEVIDPTADKSTKGQLYLSGRIYIGAKKLLNPETKFEALGTLAHELCHYAMNLVYENFARPYTSRDNKTEQDFEEISNYCEKYSRKEETIDAVYNAYESDMFHAELVVRVPHLIMKYSANKEKLQEVRNQFIKLFEIFENKFIPEMKKALPKITAKAEKEANEKEKKIKKLKVLSGIVGIVSFILIIIGVLVTRSIFYAPIYSFSTLSPEDKIKVETAHVIYKKVEVEFQNLFPKNSSAYYNLTSEHIDQMLHNIPLDFDDPHYLYLNDLIFFEWKNLTLKLKKNKFLNSNFLFQNETLKLESLNEISPNSFYDLTSNQIILVLSGEILKIHEMTDRTSLFYMERNFFIEDIYAIYFNYMYERAKVHSELSCTFENITGTFDVSFDSFYDNFTNQDMQDQINTVNYYKNIIKQRSCSLNDFIIEYIYNNGVSGILLDTLYDHKLLQYSFDKLFEQANKTKLLILSSQSGTGKTTSLQEFAIRIKKKNPFMWVSYIDARNNRDCFTKVKSLKDVKVILENIFKLGSGNEFERKIFEESFHNGNMILLWDHLDQISEFDVDILEIIKKIHKETKNVQFLSTRLLYSDELRDVFQQRTFTLVPLINQTEEFSRLSFESRQIYDSNYTEMADKIANLYIFGNDVYSPFLLDMIVDSLITKSVSFDDINYYDLINAFIDKRIQIWTSTSEKDKDYVNKLIESGFSVREFYQKYAISILKNTFIYSQFYYFIYKLKIIRRTIRVDIPNYEISRMGILYIENQKSFEIVHETFITFFVAQYIIDNIYNAEDDPTETEAEIRLQLFFHNVYEQQYTRDYILHYIRKNSTDSREKFHYMIASVLRNKFRNILLNFIRLSTGDLYFFYIKFFEKDHELLIDLLKINENENYFDASFDFAYLLPVQMPFGSREREEIKKFGINILTADEYERVLENKKLKTGFFQYNLYLMYNYYKNMDVKNVLDFYYEYKLDDSLLESKNITFVFETILSNLSDPEKKQLITSKIIFYPVMTLKYEHFIVKFIEIPLDFYKKIWALLEELLSENELKMFMRDSLELVFFFENTENQNFLLKKIEKIFNNTEIIEIFLSKNIAQLTAFYRNDIDEVGFQYRQMHLSARIQSKNRFSSFNNTWEYIKTISSPDQQRKILLHQADIECYANYVYTFNSCYFIPPLNTFHAVLSEFYPDPKYFDVILDEYMHYFNTSELQEMILSTTKDFIPFLVKGYPIESCKFYADALKIIFKDNINILKNYLTEKIEYTKLSIIDVISEFQNCDDIVKMFTDLYEN